jgi:hypothetical protein
MLQSSTLGPCNGDFGLNPPPGRSHPLPPNTVPEPDANRAERHEIVFNGGMMGGMMMRHRGMGMNMMDMMRSERFGWKAKRSDGGAWYE